MGKLAELYVDIIGNAAPLYSTLGAVQGALGALASPLGLTLTLGAATAAVVGFGVHAGRHRPAVP